MWRLTWLQAQRSVRRRRQSSAADVIDVDSTEALTTVERGLTGPLVSGLYAMDLHAGGTLKADPVATTKDGFGDPTPLEVSPYLHVDVQTHQMRVLPPTARDLNVGAILSSAAQGLESCPGDG